MSLNNLANVLSLVYAALKRRDLVGDSREFFDPAIQLVNEALNQIVRDTVDLGVFRAESTDSLVADQATYDYPTDILDRLIFNIWVLDSSDNKTRLSPVTTHGLDIDSDMWRGDASSTVEEWLHDAEEEKLRLHPAPDTAVSSGLLIHYVKQHPFVFRRWGSVVDESKLISVTNASAAATLSGAATADEFQTGDYLGVILPKAGDRTALRYYSTTVVGAAVTLGSAYDGPTDAKAQFVTGQNIALLEMYPAFGLALVFLTCRMASELWGSVEQIKTFEALYQGKMKHAYRSANTLPGRIGVGELM